jgi:hypothetical protein
MQIPGQMTGFRPVIKPAAPRQARFGKDLQREEIVKNQLEQRLRDIGFGPDILHRVQGLDLGQEGYEILLWVDAKQEKYQSVLNLIAEMTGAPQNPKSNVFRYEGVKVSVWPQVQIGRYGGGGGGLDTFGPNRGAVRGPADE